MITKSEILKMVTNIGKHRQGFKNRKLIKPEREWAIGLSVFTILLIAGFWYNAVTFSYYNNIEDNLEVSNVSIPNYDQGILTKVLEKYDQRKRQFDEIRSGITPVAVNEDVAVEDPTATSTEEVIAEEETPEEVLLVPKEDVPADGSEPRIDESEDDRNNEILVE